MRALTIPGLTTDEDVVWLAAQAAQASVIIEIGPFKGRCTVAMLDAHPSSRIYAIDNWNAALTPGRSDQAARAAFYRHVGAAIGQRVFPIERNSRDGLPPELVGVEADLLWIDGDHSREGVQSDIATYGPLVRRDGLICGHDYCVWHPDVVAAVDACFGARVRSISPKRSIWWIT